MSAFGVTTTKHPTSSTLSENDQYVLRTLFNPFSVRFGYLDSNEVQFNNDLKEIRPLIEDMLDFEKEKHTQKRTADPLCPSLEEKLPEGDTSTAGGLRHRRKAQ